VGDASYLCILCRAIDLIVYSDLTTRNVSDGTCAKLGDESSKHTKEIRLLEEAAL